MRTLLLIFFVAVVGRVRADESATVAEVRAADDARVAAMAAVDANALNALLADGLYYGHSGDGFVEDKAHHIASLVSRSLIYRRFDFKSRDFTVVSPGAVICKGRAIVEVGNPRRMFLADINFLAVWRLENQRWKLFAWQSSRNADFVPIDRAPEDEPRQP
jgi:Domain of unknown function (DUF4440)